MKTKILVFSVFFMSLFLYKSSFASSSDNFITTKPQVRFILMSFHGKTTKNFLVPIFYSKYMTMKIPAKVTGGSDVKFSYLLLHNIPADAAEKANFHFKGKDKNTRFLAVETNIESPVFFPISPSSTATFYVVNSPGRDAKKTTFIKVDVKLYQSKGDSTTIDWSFLKDKGDSNTIDWSFLKNK